MSLERDFIYDNLLDRIRALEAQLAELQERAATLPEATPAVDQPTWANFSGWLVTGSRLQDTQARIILDPATPLIQLAAGGYIRSADFVAGSAGFEIDGGTAEFNDVVVRGTIYADVGVIAGWTLASSELYAGSGASRVGLRPGTYPLYAGAEDPASAPFRVTAAGAVTASSGLIAGWTLASSELYAGSGASRVGLRPGTYPLYAGAEDPASAPFRVTAAGAVTASSANITGTIDANAGHIGSLDVDGVLTVGTVAPYIQIDGPNKRIRTSTFATGLQGFSLEGDGSAEFANVSVRGEIHAAVLAYGEQLATSGTLIVAKAAGKLRADVTTVASPTAFNVDVEDPDTGHVPLFAVGDVLRLQDATRTNWVTVQSVSDQTTFYRYVCVLSNGTAGTFRAGAVATDYGQSGQGVLLLTGDQTNAPFYSVRTHAGSPWSAETEVARLGNLNGNWGYGAAAYGLALGEYAASQANLTWDPTNGLRLRTYTTTVLQLDASGNADITGKLRLPGTGSALAIGSTPPTGSAAGTGIWIDRTGLFALSGGTYQVKIDATNGKLYAGGGAAIVDASGLTLTPGTAGENEIKWISGGTTYGKIRAQTYEAKTTLYFYLPKTGSNAYAVGLFLGAEDGVPVTYPVTVQIDGADVLGINASTAYLPSSMDLRIGGGLAVGSTSVNPGSGQIYCGNIGFGNTSPASTCGAYTTIAFTETDVSDGRYGIKAIVFHNPASAASGYMYGVRGGVRTDSSNNSSLSGDYRGIESSVIWQSQTGTLTNAYGFISGVYLNSIGTISNAYGFYSNIGDLPSGGGAIMTAYHIYLAAMSGSGIATKWGIYQASSKEKNFFAGNVGIGTDSISISDGIGLHLGGKILRIGTSKTPASARATGYAGEICWDSSYIYVCTATNTWKRAALATW